MKYLLQSLSEIERRGNYPRVDTISSKLGAKVRIGDEEFLLFSSNSYLGISTHPNLIRASIEATKKYGTSAGASRLVSGTFDIHDRLEQEIADFKGTEAAMVLSSGYSVNVSLIPALANVFSLKEDKLAPKTVIFSDELNHASIIDGAKLAGTQVIVYPHRNMSVLEDYLVQYDEFRKLIITDSVFSMDGDIAPLDEIVKLSKDNDAFILIDEAHATGVLGECGRGAANLFNVTDDIQVIMGTFSKALASIGGYICASKEIIKLLKVAVRGYVFSTALPPSDVAVSLAAIEYIKKNRSVGSELLAKAEYLRKGLKKIGFNTLGSATQIVPILIGDELRGLEFQAELRKRKIIAPCVQWPAVERAKSRIRFSLMASHTQEDLEFLLTSCKEIKNMLYV